MVFILLQFLYVLYKFCVRCICLVIKLYDCKVMGIVNNFYVTCFSAKVELQNKLMGSFKDYTVIGN